MQCLLAVVAGGLLMASGGLSPQVRHGGAGPEGQ